MHIGDQQFPCLGCTYGQAPEAAGAVTAIAAQTFSPVRSVALGVVTGVLVWATTKFLSSKGDRHEARTRRCRCAPRRCRS